MVDVSLCFLSTKEMRAALRRIDLHKMYQACNRKWFGGKLPKPPNIVMANKKKWKEWGGDGTCIAFHKAYSKCIVFDMEYFVARPGRLLAVMVHEMAHASVFAMSGKPWDIRLKKDGNYAKNPCVQHGHGERFGDEMRRLRAMGAPVDRTDLYWGREGKKIKHDDQIKNNAWDSWRWGIWDERYEYTQMADEWYDRVTTYEEWEAQGHDFDRDAALAGFDNL